VDEGLRLVAERDEAAVVGCFKVGRLTPLRLRTFWSSEFSNSSGSSWAPPARRLSPPGAPAGRASPPGRGLRSADSERMLREMLSISVSMTMMRTRTSSPTFSMVEMSQTNSSASWETSQTWTRQSVAVPMSTKAPCGMIDTTFPATANLQVG
jgi:hypothetical protein